MTQKTINAIAVMTFIGNYQDRTIGSVQTGKGDEVGMKETDKLLVRVGTARDAISRKTEQTSLDYMIDGVLMNCSVMLKEQEERIETLESLRRIEQEGR